MCLCYHTAVFKEIMNLNYFLLPLLHIGLQGERDDQLTRGEGVISGQVASLVQGHIEKQTTIPTHMQPQNLKFPIHLTCMSLECGREPENSKRSLTETGGNSTQGLGSNPQPACYEKAPLTTAPACRPNTFTTHIVVCATTSMKNKTWDTLLWVNDSVLVARVFYTYLLWLSAVQ